MEASVVSVNACPICAGEARRAFSKGVYDIARCDRCRTLFVIDPPANTEALYNDSYFGGGEQGHGYGSYDEVKEATRDTLELCLDRIAEHAPKGAFYDIGAATGYFLACARGRGYSVSGVDISASAAREAAKKGITVHVGAVIPAVAEGSQDVVTAFDVLEHVPNPAEVVREVLRVLRAGGVFMGSTPNSTSRFARIMGKFWTLLVPPEHLVLMSERGLRELLEKHGYTVVWMEALGKRFTIPYIFQIAGVWLNVRFLSRIAEWLRRTPLGRVAIPLNFYDNLFFLAIKNDVPTSGIA